jgi:8-oxo-dGTP pyrophosphatase MutT (NUDIX family)
LRNGFTVKDSTTDASAQSGPPNTGRRAFERKIRAILATRSRYTLSDPSLTCAAVLIPLLLRDGEWCVLVTQRTQHVEHHKGQISFPGGACDPEDASLEATALREVQEEIGIPPEAVEVLGALDDLQTVTDFSVTPFVGIIPHPFSYRLNSAEVEAVIEVPLTFLRDRDKLRVEPVEYKGELRDVLFWDYGSHVIWGATARILKGFIDLLP